MGLFETNENEAIDSPRPRSNEAKTPHRKIYNSVKELTTVRSRQRVCNYGISVAIGPPNANGDATERKHAKGAKSKVWTRK